MSDAAAAAPADPLEKVIRACGEGWLIDWYAPWGQAMPNLHRILADAHAHARRRLGGGAPPLTAESLVAEYARNPHKVKAFVQVMGSVATPDILVMVYRILQGMEIRQIALAYESQTAFHLRIVLRSPYGDGDDEVYETRDIDDAVILRHVGVMKISGAPVFDGFYPLNLK